MTPAFPEAIRVDVDYYTEADKEGFSAYPNWSRIAELVSGGIIVPSECR